MLDLATHVLQSYETIFDFDNKKSRLHEINLDLESPAVWSDQVLSQQLSREKASIWEPGAFLPKNRARRSFGQGRQYSY